MWENNVEFAVHENPCNVFCYYGWVNQFSSSSSCPWSCRLVLSIQCHEQLHYTALHYTALHYTALHHATQYHIMLHNTTLCYTTLHYATWHCIYIVLCYLLFQDIPHDTTLFYAALHYTLHCITLQSYANIIYLPMCMCRKTVYLIKSYHWLLLIFFF